MAQGMFIAEVIDDGMAYGKDVANRLKSVASLLTGGGTIPIGAVEWRTGGDPSLPAVTGIASPLLPYLGQIPLIGEYILVFNAPTTDNSDSTAAEGYYYIGPIQIDGSKNSNITQGIFKRTGTENLTIPKPLVPVYAKKKVDAVQPFFGDTIIQDRNGSCIRMSSTQLPTGFKYMDGTIQTQVPFKSTGTPRISKKGPLVTPESAGNPIMQLTVGFPGQATKSLTKLAGDFGAPTTLIENIDADKSLIYLTSDQRLIYKMTRKFPNTSAKQPNTAGKIFETKDDGLYNGANKGTVYNKKSKSISTTSIAGSPGKKGLENPAHGPAKFLQVNAYPSDPRSRSQILLRSNRLILDAQRDSILMCAFKDIKMGTLNWRCELDSTMGLIEELIKQVAILTTHVYDLGNGLQEHIDINKKVQYPTGVGPTGPCLSTYNKEYNDMTSRITADFLPNLQARLNAIDVIAKEFKTMRRTPAEKSKKEVSS